MKNNENINIYKWKTFADNMLSKRLEKISLREEAMIPRSKEFYDNAINSDRLVLAIESKTNKIVWSGLLLPLSSNWFEIWSIYVDKNFRNHWISTNIVKKLILIWKEQTKNVLTTMKPNIKWSEWMIVSASKNWIIPVSFDFLKNDNEAYKNCCVCNDENCSINCKDRNCKCILWVLNNSKLAIDMSNEFIQTPTFKEAIINEKVRNKVLKNIQEIFTKNL